MLENPTFTLLETLRRRPGLMIQATALVNAAYDRLGTEIMRRALGTSDSFVDVGCHAGKVMDDAIAIAPHGRHIGFEPLPEFAVVLRARYAGHPSVSIVEAALSNEAGWATFVRNLDDPSYSGLRERTYPKPDSRLQRLQVRTMRLDEAIGDLTPRLIKIDVEGGEYLVLQGAERCLRRFRPLVIFEFGMGTKHHYEHQPHDIAGFLGGCGLRLYCLDGWLKGDDPLTAVVFASHYDAGEFYFVAA